MGVAQKAEGAADIQSGTGGLCARTGIGNFNGVSSAGRRDKLDNAGKALAESLFTIAGRSSLRNSVANLQACAKCPDAASCAICSLQQGHDQHVVGHDPCELMSPGLARPKMIQQPFPVSRPIYEI